MRGHRSHAIPDPTSSHQLNPLKDIHPYDRQATNLYEFKKNKNQQEWLQPCPCLRTALHLKRVFLSAREQTEEFFTISDRGIG